MSFQNYVKTEPNIDDEKFYTFEVENETFKYQFEKIKYEESEDYQIIEDKFKTEIWKDDAVIVPDKIEYVKIEEESTCQIDDQLEIETHDVKDVINLSNVKCSYENDQKITFGTETCKVEDAIIPSEIKKNRDVDIHLYKFQCVVCERCFKMKHHLLRHETIHIRSGEIFYCDTCKKPFKSKQYLTEHMNTHFYDCSKCSKRMFTKLDFLQHGCNLTHLKQKKCSECGKMFIGHSSLSQHKTNQHNPSPSFQCIKCEKVFKCKMYLSQHMKVHESLRFECDICGKVLKTKKILSLHIDVHNETHNFECHNCGKVFKTKRNLKHHMKIHSRPFNFKCDSCGKLFNAKWSLHRHVEYHNQTYDLECRLCGKVFKTRECVRRHMYTHRISRDYECNNCGKKFKTKGYLLQHMFSHEKSYNFECTKCGKAMKTSSGLSRHVCKQS